MKKLLKVFRVLLFVISVTLITMSFIAIFFVLNESRKMDLLFNNQGFLTFINLFHPYVTLLTATFIIISVFIALESLISNLNNQEGKALLDLRILFNTDDNLDVHKKLRGESGEWAKGIPKKEKDNENTWRKIDNYLGILELLNIIIDKDVISIKNFYNQFGYRVDNVYHNDSITEYLNGYGKEQKESWGELFKLFKKRNLNLKKFTDHNNV